MKTDNEMALDALAKAEKIKKTRIKRYSLVSIISLTVIVLCTFGALSIAKDKKAVGEKDKNNQYSISEYTVSKPEIEKQPQYPTADYMSSEYENEQDKWFEYSLKRRTENMLDKGALTHFVTKTSSKLLGRSDGKNKTFSPMNLYIAMSMLAETTGGETRDQILNLLCADSMEKAAENAKHLYRGNYIDDGTVKSIPANSIWLNDTFSPNTDTLKRLSDYYNAYSFKGNPEDEKYSKAFCSWLNDNTGNLLQDAVKDMKFDDNMLVTLASTLNYSARWQDEFDTKNTKEGIFHGANGDTTAQYMYEKNMSVFYSTYLFDAYGKSMANDGGTMYFLLPNEEYTPEFVLNSIDTVYLFENMSELAERTYTTVNFTVPKFDVSFNKNIADDLKKLGVHDVFDSEKSDFSPLCNQDGIYLSEVNHACRVKIDEEGCEAAAFTVEMLCGASMPEGEINFTLDRPFIFILTGNTGEILFMGVVNNV